VYYAVKSNNHPEVATALLDAGVGLDVSSGDELEMALRCGATDVVFSGPGKTEEELWLAVRNRESVTVLMDSFAELARLDQIASKVRTSVRAGVRVATDDRGLWRKFGIRLSALPRFVDETQTAHSRVRLCGLQFHTSWNLDPNRSVRFLERLGRSLAALDDERRAWVEFIDIGGGFWPEQGEWLQAAGTPEGKLRLAASPSPAPRRGHYKRPAVCIGEFAGQIARAIRTHIFPHVSCRVCMEPGRWLCNDAMHILLRVVDRKADDLVITDGGTNAVGWERFEVDYFPVINLSRPALTERACDVLGSLCTPHDVWGYAYFGTDIWPGDILLIPTQGAYTYSLRQHFIKPLPKVAFVGAAKAGHTRRTKTNDRIVG
jgi:diaminopimelate decarboxylase